MRNAGRGERQRQLRELLPLVYIQWAVESVRGTNEELWIVSAAQEDVKWEESERRLICW